MAGRAARSFGRAREQVVLDDLLRDLIGGSSRVAVISGDAGIGKSALVADLTARAERLGIPVLVGECMQIETQRPFGPFIEIAQAAVVRGVAGISRDALRRERPEVAALLSWPDPQPAEEPDRHRVHRALAAFVRQLARDAPLAIVVEDIHWSDEATLELLPYLARRLRDLPLSIVATLRTDEDPRETVATCVTELGRTSGAARIRLRALDAPAIGELVRDWLGLGGDAAAPLLAALAQCEGNPFFIEETLRALSDAGDLVERDGRWTIAPSTRALPASVRTAVVARLRHLTAGARDLIATAAVIGPRFAFALLREVAARDAASLLGDVRQMIDAGLIVRSDDSGDGSFAFRHALTRESVLRELLPAERRPLHLAVAQRLVSSGDRGREAEIAYHFDEAGDRENAAIYQERAARAALDLSAFAQARRHLDRAIALLGDDDDRARPLLLSLASVAFELNDLAAARRAADEAVRRAERMSDARALGRALRVAATMRYQSGDVAGADAALAAALNVLGPLGEIAELAGLYRDAGAFAIFNHDDHQAARRWIEAGLRLARAHGLPSEEVMCLSFLGFALAEDDPPESMRLTRAAADLAFARGLVGEAIRVQLNLYLMLARIGAPASEVDAALRAARAHADRHDLHPDRLISIEAQYAYERGCWERADAYLATLGESPFTAGARFAGALAAAARHGPERGIALIEEPRRQLLAAGSRLYRKTASWSAEVMMLAGDPRAALEHAESAADLLDAFGAPDEVAIAAICAAVELEDASGISRWIALSLAAQRESEPLATRARRAFARAEDLAQRGELDGAIALHASDTDLFARALRPFAFTLTQLRRAQLLVRRAAPGDRAEAASAFAAAVSFWRDAGAAWYVARLRERAAAAGLPFPRTDPRRTRGMAASRGPASLSRREREVAALVADGLTNKEIAERLVIAERTAEGHVERIREKLGFRSRAQIVSWIAGRTMPAVGAEQR